MRNGMIEKGDHQTPVRSLLYTTGALKSLTGMNKSLVAICNSYIDTVPGYVHLRKFAGIAKEAIREADVIPFRFDITGADDGIAMGHIGTRCSLPSREVIADAAEAVINAHWFNGIFYIPNCDKITPGMVLAVVRTNVPAVFCSGGPMKAGLSTHGKTLTLSSIFKAIGVSKEGSISEGEFLDMEQNARPTCGSCTGMFTANLMDCLMEVLGPALPYNDIALATSDQQREMIHQAASRLVESIKNDLKSCDIVTREAINDVFALNMTMGGSTNTVLHTLVTANEAGIDYDLECTNVIARRTLYLSKVTPSSSYSMHDIHEADDVPAIINGSMKEDGTLHPDRITVTGRILHESSEGKEIKSSDIIHPLDIPYNTQGGLSISSSNVASKDAVTKVGGVDSSIRTFTGKATCFNLHDETVEAIGNHTVHVGHIVVIRYEGPKGGPGVSGMLTLTPFIVNHGLGKDATLITDGRFSGTTRGIAVGYISPGAASGGPIALIEDDDEIITDLTNRTLNVNQPKDVLAHRREPLILSKAKVKVDYPARYTTLVTNVNIGGVTQVPKNLI